MVNDNHGGAFDCNHRRLVDCITNGQMIEYTTYGMVDNNHAWSTIPQMVDRPYGCHRTGKPKPTYHMHAQGGTIKLHGYHNTHSPTTYFMDGTCIPPIPMPAKALR